MVQTEVMTREQMMSALEAKGVNVISPSENFNGSKGGIWIAAENTPHMFDYWNDGWGNTFGVQPKLNEFIESFGWYFEWYDAGTMFAWEI